MIEYKDYHFEVNKLFLGTVDTGMSYFEYAPGLFKIQFEDGSQSEDFYNLDRVKDNIRKYHMRSMNSTAENSPTCTPLMR